MTQTKIHTGVGVQVWARSTTYVANELLRVLQEVVQERGLELDYMHDHFELFTNSFRTWVTGRYLQSVVLEIWNANSDELVERYDLGLDYDTTDTGGGDERFNTYVEQLRNALRERPALSDDYRYRVVVQLESGAPKLRGWSSTSLRDTHGLRRERLSDRIIDTARIGVALDYWL